MVPLLALALLVAAPRDTLVVGLLADPVSLHPHRATDLVSAAVVSTACETLVRFRAGGTRPEPGLATTWATLDTRAWTFTLREGVRFHDGTPLDADAVVANVESLRKERAFPGRAERLGPSVVTITLERPNASLLATLSQPFFGLQSPRQLVVGEASAPSRPVGTGPFRFVSARPGLMELEANLAYWHGAPRLAKLVFRRYPTADSLTVALREGEVDVTSALSPEYLKTLRRTPETIHVESRPGLNLAFLSINNERAPFQDRRVRQALARAIDRNALVEQALGGHGEPARNPLPPSLWGYGAHTRELILDRSAARRLLIEAGLPNGFESTLMVVDVPRPYLPTPRVVADRIRQSLGEVGIRLKVREVPSWAEYVGAGSRGDYDLAVLGWQADTTDPNDFLSALLESDAVGTTNRSRFRSPAMDTLLERARRSGDPQQRLTAYAEVQRLFQKEMPWIPLYHASVLTAQRRSVDGITTGPSGILRYDKAWKSN